jgi:uracil-DNA glycosylase
MNVIFKLRHGLSAAAQAAILQDLKESGATGHGPLLPGDPDADARLMFVASAPTAAVARKLVTWLNARREVDYAEISPGRRPQS